MVCRGRVSSDGTGGGAEIIDLRYLINGDSLLSGLLIG